MIDIFRKRKIQELEDKIASLTQEIFKEKNNAKIYKEVLEMKNNNTVILEENQKLISWIRSILEEFGTFEVREKNTVHIPVHKKSNILPFRYENEEIPRCEDKIIVIPEIVIHERKY